MSQAQRIFEYLDELGIRYEYVTHAPARTMADCAQNDARLHALTPKNLFLTTKSRRRHYLCLTRPEARFVTSDVSRQAGSPRLSFAPEDALWDMLRCRPGSASPLGLIFDIDRRVRLLVDAALKDAPALGFHPCDNTMTLVMSGEDFFQTFLPSVSVTPQFIETDPSGLYSNTEV